MNKKTASTYLSILFSYLYKNVDLKTKRELMEVYNDLKELIDSLKK